MDLKHNLVAYPSKDLKGITISNIFDSSKNIEIIRNFSPSATVWQVASGEFTDQGFTLNYFDGPNQIEKREIIPLDYSKFNN